MESNWTDIRCENCNRLLFRIMTEKLKNYVSDSIKILIETRCKGTRCKQVGNSKGMNYRVYIV